MLSTAVEPRRAPLVVMCMAAVHPLPLAWCPLERGGSAKGTIRVSYHRFSNSELDSLPEQGYSSLKKEQALSGS